jgi:hypothetical protein
MDIQKCGKPMVSLGKGYIKEKLYRKIKRLTKIQQIWINLTT